MLQAPICTSLHDLLPDLYETDSTAPMIGLIEQNSCRLVDINPVNKQQCQSAKVIIWLWDINNALHKLTCFAES